MIGIVMLSDDQLVKLKTVLPILKNADAQLLNALRREAFFARISAGHDVFVEGDDANAIALLISGVVRVYKIGDNAREITLYRFGTGESCILTANAILSQQTFPAIANVEQDVEAVMIPADTFRRWIREYDQWREFVFTLLSQRLLNVMEIVDAVTFRRMDIRVAALLLERSSANNFVNLTHREIAAELGSSREVVSRILEDMADRGMIRVLRGTVEIVDPELLKTQATR
ncbi:MAG: Crp/Fnr family transcriptional regulator [Anaerolineae bacterium]|nr:Crp/Fnr family transcriptional regulator [Anaerolineae bacterium]